MPQQIFLEITSVIVITIITAGLARVFKQPLIIAYIIAGLIVSPYGLNLITSPDAIENFSQFGVAFLLFMVGLDLSPSTVKNIGKIALLTGLGQVLFTSSIGFILALIFQFSIIESLYIAAALTFSSTIVVLKLLSDKKDLETLYGKIAVGMVIVQSIVAMLVLIFISSTGQSDDLTMLIVGTIGKGGILIALVLATGFYVLPHITKKIASNQEFLMLFAIGWCFALASIFHLLNFSSEIGALLAGISLSLSPYRYEIASRIRPLRDFFLVMFFIFLGSQMELENFSAYILPVVVFSVFILIGNPLSIIAIMGLSGYTKRTGFLLGLTVAQISEFSLILIAMGIKSGHLQPDILGFMTIVALITIAGSSYFIIYGKKLYRVFAKHLSMFERKGPKVDHHKYITSESFDVMILGFNHVGLRLSRSLQKLRKKFLVIDFNPETIINLAQKNIECRYGDVEDDDIFEEINLKDLKMVVSSIKDFDINKSVIKRIRVIDSKAIIIVVSERIEEALELYNQGASYVIMPHYLGGSHTSMLIEEYGLDINKFVEEKLKHLKELKKR